MLIDSSGSSSPHSGQRLAAADGAGESVVMCHLGRDSLTETGRREQLPQLGIRRRTLVTQPGDDQLLRGNDVQLALHGAESGNKVGRSGGNQWTGDELTAAHHLRLSVEPPQIAI